MLFNSSIFILLLLITFILYYLPWLKKYQVLILILSSLVFYSYESPELLILLLLSASINIYSSYFVAYGQYKNKKLIATLGMIANLGILAAFKYSSLFSKTFFDQSTELGHFLVTIPLPIGISFYTFEGISLLIDVYRDREKNETKLVSTSLFEHCQKTLFFISFFPHLVSGPILKAHDFIPQIGEKNIININWESCFKNLAIGFFLKMVVADNLKDFTFWIAYPYFEARSTCSLVTMLYGYSFQIFADFAGYSLIAIGLAELFGYNLMKNFNFPYISTSFQEFWKRWHISLSSFLMEYLYIPLGGNRKGKGRTYFNLILTMFLGGLWHGAAWSYAAWGLWHGFALAIERLLTNPKKITKSNLLVTIIKQLFVFTFISFAWLFFKLPNFDHVIAFVKAMINNVNMGWGLELNTIFYSIPIIIYHQFYLYRSNIRFQNFILKYQYLIYGLMLFLIITNSGSSGSFIYFQF